jgi:hypothetical protein
MPLQSTDHAKTLPGIMACLALICCTGCQPPPPSLLAGNYKSVAEPRIGGARIEACDRAEQFQLRYHRRELDLDVDRFGQIRLDAAAERSAEEGKRILLEALEVTLDLSREQWPSVFVSWFCRVNGLPSDTVLHGAPVVIAGRPAWEYTYAASEPGTTGSRFWRVYLIPAGRTATVIRSAGWKVEDASRYGSLLDQVAASLKSN